MSSPAPSISVPGPAARALDILNTLDTLTAAKQAEGPKPVNEVMAFHAECQVAATAAGVHATLALNETLREIRDLLRAKR